MSNENTAASQPPPTGAGIADATPEQRRGMRLAIIAQCFGTLAHVAFRYGQVVLYLAALGLSDAKVVFYASLPMSFELLRLPMAYFADRYGKKRTGTIGLGMTVCGFVFWVLAGFLGRAMVEPMVLTGTICYGLGQALFSSSWFALLSPVVPADYRGRFFGKLRFGWQMVGMCFVLATGFFLGFGKADPPLWKFQLVFITINGGLLMRAFFYQGIPELEKATLSPGTLWQIMGKVIMVPKLLPFCAYLSLLMFFVGSAPLIFTMIQKDVLALPKGQVLVLMAVVMFGLNAGYLIVGSIIDRFGTKPVFLGCHFGYALTIFLIVMRGWISPLALQLVYLGVVGMALGFISASSSVAITSEMLGLAPRENKSLATSMVSCFEFGAVGVGGAVWAWVLSSDMLAPTWTFWGLAMSRHDTLLLGFSGMVLLLVITLGLVPSVFSRYESVPGR